MNDTNALSFLDDSPGLPEAVDMMASQKTLLKSILNIDSQENNSHHINQSQAETEVTLEDDTESLIVGAGEGVPVEKQLFMFKVLIYDDLAETMIAPLLKVGELRDCNVILHSSLKSKREPCPGLPAIYLVQPTQENYQAIAADCQKGLYDFVFVYFSRAMSDSDLDKFAIEMTRVSGAERIARVAYEHLGAYQVVNKNFFSLQTHTNNFKDLYL